MNIKEFLSAIYQIAEERALEKEKVLEAAAEALAGAYKKETQRKRQKIVARIDLEKGKIKFFQALSVIEDKEKENPEFKFQPEKEIFLSEAKKIKKDVRLGEEILVKLPEVESFGRIASQAGKQILFQRLREIEKNTLYDEFKDQEGKIVSGIVQKLERGNVYLQIGKVLGVIRKEEQIPYEYYRPGRRLKAYVLRVEKTSRGVELFLSRSFPKFVSKLFEIEVPEILHGQVEIVSIAREAGFRTKIAVKTNVKEIDPVGALIGPKGMRIQMVIEELGGEKIDVVLYSDDPGEYIKNALSPAKILDIQFPNENTALCLVEKSQVSLAIGKNGQNVRLASKLTGYQIDIKEIE